MADKLDEFKKKLLRTKKDGQWTPPTAEEDALLAHVRKLVTISRSEMSKNYVTWDMNDSVFRSRRLLDKEDRSATAKGNAPKLIVPLTFAQVMTFVSFGVQTMTQEKRFFQLEPTGSEDDPLVEPMEKTLERDTKRNNWNAFLVQHFLDLGRFSLGCAEVCYEEKKRRVRVPVTESVEGGFGTVTEETSVQWQEVPVFVGNRVYPVSPYRILPDTRLPLTRYQEGEFCGSEDMWSMSSLRGDKSLFNLNAIPKMEKEEADKRRQVSRMGPMELRGMDRSAPHGDAEGDGMVKSGSVVVTKVVLDIVPKDFEVNGKTVLGDEDFPVRYICWYANDKTVIRFEEAYWLHGQFPYIINQFMPDQHMTVNEGLADVCDQISNTITWLVNTSITSKRSNLEGKFIVDPAGIDIKSLESRDPYIRLKKNAAQTGVDRYIKQFQTTDPTTNNLQEVGILKELLEGVTGYSGIMQGQYSSGRRDATQSRVVTQGASARAKTTLGSIWEGFQNLGRQFLANNRQDMDFDTFRRIVGDSPTSQLNEATGAPWTVEELYSLFVADPVTIASAEQFFIYDGTQPSEKAYLAQSLEGTLQIVLQNPEVMQVLGWDPNDIRWLLNEVFTLRGVTPARLPKPKAVPMLAPAAGQNVVPMGAAPAAPPPAGGLPATSA